MYNNTEIIATSIDGFHLEFAAEEDVPLILDFIRRLARYEKLSHEVVATEELLKENLFGEHSYAEVVIGYFNQDPVGFALFFHNFSTFLGRPGIYLEDLFVMESWRGNGFGKKILTFLAHLAVERGCGRLEWSVLDWNTPAIEFYNSLGGDSMDDWTVFRLTGNPLDNLASEFN